MSEGSEKKQGMDRCKSNPFVETMKKALCVIVVSLFFNGIAQAQSFSPINIFEQRRIVIGGFENLGDPLYEYIEPAIRTTLYTMARSIPFITISEKERLFLDTLSKSDKFREAFDQAHGEIKNKMETAVTLEAPVGDEFPLVLFGNYTIAEPGEHSEAEVLSITVNERNMMTAEEKLLYEKKIELADFLESPELNLFPVFRNFLPYKTYMATLTAQPPDALITLDNRLLGTGAVSGIFVTPGNHRVTVTRNGYREFSDIVFFNTDPFSMHIDLKKITTGRKYTLYTLPSGADVYLDEAYLGKTPLTLDIDRDDQVITLIHEGYRTTAIDPSTIDKKTGTIDIVMEKPEKWDQIVHRAERSKKRGALLSYAGFGTIGLVILFGTLKTLNRQKADLYIDKDPDIYDNAVRLSRTYNALVVSSSILTLGIFTFSFIETLQYFKLYGRTESPTDSVPIVRGKVQF